MNRIMAILLTIVIFPQYALAFRMQSKPAESDSSVQIIKIYPENNDVLQALPVSDASAINFIASAQDENGVFYFFVKPGARIQVITKTDIKRYTIE